MTQQGGVRLRAAVIGLGAMGRHHVRVLGELPGVELVAVADMSEEAVGRITERALFAGYTDIAQMLDTEQPEFVSIVVPTSAHLPVAMLAIARGIHCLVEKPIAGTTADAWAMIGAAERAGVHLMIGHIERFNPAIIELKRRVEQVGTIFQVSARRVGPFPPRIGDVGVVIDLATHDIDAMRYVLDDEIQQVYAQTAQRLHTAHEDMVVGTMRFTSGTIGALDVNWLTPTKVRELTVIGSHGTFVANYLTQELVFYENAGMEDHWSADSALQSMLEGHSTRYSFQRIEPLRSELEAFVDSVRTGRTVPAPPEGAAQALEVALDLLESARSGQPVRVPAGANTNLETR
jgi:UDP-N-acetylglucosamine 3-dehydrogenase